MTAITLSNINKRFGEKVLFRDYSLHIEAGEFAQRTHPFPPALRFACDGTSCPTCFRITGWWTPTPWKPT